MDKILSLFKNFRENEFKIFNNSFFGYRKITVERPKVEERKTIYDKKGNPKPDTKLRDHERVPLDDDIEKYFKEEVQPYLPNLDNYDKVKIGYEINFTKYFYKYKPLKSTEISRELKDIEDNIREIQKQFLINGFKQCNFWMVEWSS